MPDTAAARRWQAWMALLPCVRCGWMPEDRLCAAGVAVSAPPPPPEEEPGPVLRVLTLDERRAAYASIPEAIPEVVAEQKNDLREGAA